MRLLCIEDNSALVESLRRLLADGPNISHAGCGEEGLRLAAGRRYDAIILDLGLPDMPGLEVCRILRRRGIGTPILVLSAVKDTHTKVELFKAGADDFMTKPFTRAELRARLSVLHKRSGIDKKEGARLLTVGSLTLDPLSRQVRRGGKTIRLRRKEFDILEYLMRNQGKIVTRSMIMDNIWESCSSPWDSTINVHIKRVRDKIDRPYRRKFIKTAYGLGYTIEDR
jgi:DNA-binding response OmpR family regulator